MLRRDGVSRRDNPEKFMRSRCGGCRQATAGPRTPPERGRGDPPRPWLSPGGGADCGHRSAAMCSPLRQRYFHRHRLPGQPPCPCPSWGLLRVSLSRRFSPARPGAPAGSPCSPTPAGVPLQRGVPSSRCLGHGARPARSPRGQETPHSPLGAGGTQHESPARGGDTLQALFLGI